MISIESFRKKINKYIKNNNKKSGLKEIKIIKKFIGENYIPHDHIIGYLGTMCKNRKLLNTVSRNT